MVNETGNADEVDNLMVQDEHIDPVIVGESKGKDPAPVYRWRKHNINLFDTTFVQPTLEPEPDNNETPCQYFKRFVANEMLEQMPFETNCYSIQRYCESSGMHCDAKELEKFIGCYFRTSFVQIPNQKT